MQNSVLTGANHKLIFIKDFLQLLTKHLDTDTDSLQKTALKEILQGITPKNFGNLIDVKKSMLDIKEKLVNVLKTLDSQKAEVLKKSCGSLPEFMEDTFELVAVERAIDTEIGKAMEIPNVRERDDALWNISKKLTDAGKIDKAIEVALMISEEAAGRVWSFGAISEELRIAKKFDKAIEVALMSPLEPEGVVMYTRIAAQAIRERGNINNSFETAAYDLIVGKKAGGLWHIFLDLLREKDNVKALKVAMMIPQENDLKNWALYISARDFITAGNTNEALKIIEMIPEKDPLREEALTKLREL